MGYGRSVELPSEGKTPSEAKKRDGFSSMRLEHREQREREKGGWEGRQEKVRLAVWTLFCAQLGPEVTFGGMGQGVKHNMKNGQQEVEGMPGDQATGQVEVRYRRAGRGGLAMAAFGR